MNHFFTLLLAASCLTAVGQVNPDFNPDYDGDGFIGVNDILGTLSWYDSSWGVTTSWSCGDPVNYQGYDYATVQIGEQCWFAENLRAENYRNGDAVPSGLSDSDWANATSGAQAVYGQNDDCQHQSPEINACDPLQALEEYGRLYNWYVVEDVRGICPLSWHVSSKAEWSQLSDYLGGQGVAGDILKSTTGWSGGGNGSNESGFSALPGGRRYNSGYIGNAGEAGWWWSATPEGPLSWFAGADSWSSDLNQNTTNLTYGFSIRCIKD